MLTKDLLQVKKRKPNIKPRYRKSDEYISVVKEVIDTYKVGKSKGEIEKQIKSLETHDTFKFVRGLSKLLERKSEFEKRAAVSPSDLRESVFEKGYVTKTEERNQVLKEVSKEFSITPKEVEENLWKDLEREKILVSTPEISARELLKEYNLSLTQTLLFDALDLEFNVSGNYQEIFGLMKYLGLMYIVDNDLTVNVTGPASLFKKTRKYGTTLSKLIPSIIKAEEWSISAQIETEVSNEKRVYKFKVDSTKSSLFPEKTSSQSFDSEVEREFASRIDSLINKWDVKREPTILRTGNYVMIPDFSFEKGEDKFYLEVIGFWTPSYLEKKLKKIRNVQSEYPILLAVDEHLNCTKNDFDNEKIEEVFFYNSKIPVKPIVKKLKNIEEKKIERDIECLNKEKIDIDGRICDIKKISEKYNVEPDSIETYLKENYPGAISNNKYVTTEALNEIEKKINKLDSNKLSEVNQILDSYGVGQGILDDIGYNIKYISLNQDEAEIERK